MLGISAIFVIFCNTLICLKVSLSQSLHQLSVISTSRNSQDGNVKCWAGGLQCERRHQQEGSPSPLGGFTIKSDNFLQKGILTLLSIFYFHSRGAIRRFWSGKIQNNLFKKKTLAEWQIWVEDMICFSTCRGQPDRRPHAPTARKMNTLAKMPSRSNFQMQLCFLWSHGCTD